MGKLNINELTIYKWRFKIGYAFIALSLLAIILVAGLYLPGGISDQEMQSVVKNQSINFGDFNSFAITNLPYHLLQKFCLAIFGVSIFSIKLPSLVLAFISAICLILIMRLWFKPRIGVLASLIAITTGQFIFIAQDGTPGIMYLLWPVVLLLLASLISTGEKKFRMFYKVTFCIIAALSLYSPLSIYMLIAMISAIALHPHLRYIIRQLSRPKIIISILIALLLSVPLMIAVIKHPSLGLTLLGIPTKWPDFGINFASLGVQYLGFTRPGGTTLMTPFFELGSMMIIGIGVYSVARTWTTAKSYVIGLWSITLTPFIILNPNYTQITYLPLVILLAAGLNRLISHWYQLFPLNPYARIGGLIPVVILVAVLITSGLDRYVYGYKYDPNIATNFSQDLKLIPKDTKALVVSESELPFYNVVADNNKKFNVSTLPSGDTFLATKKANTDFEGYTIDKIITSSKSNNSDRFYLYKKIDK